MRAFGPETNPEIDRMETPVGALCQWCKEPIAEGDSGVAWGRQLADPSPEQPAVFEHLECFQRSILGSVAHVQRRCSCYVPGATESDPPELTLRQAAKLAVEEFQRLQKGAEDAP
jgi:hypothetical protein